MIRTPKLTAAFLLASLAIFLPLIASAAEGETALPRALLIGDSISIGYTKPVIRDLKGKVDVLGVCLGSAWGLCLGSGASSQHFYDPPHSG